MPETIGKVKSTENLLTIPQELVNIICRYLEPTDIRSIRLAYCALAHSGVNFLYQTFCLFNVDRSLANLHSIASHPEYSKFVQCIRLNSLQPNPSLDTKSCSPYARDHQEYFTYGKARRSCETFSRPQHQQIPISHILSKLPRLSTILHESVIDDQIGRPSLDRLQELTGLPRRNWFNSHHAEDYITLQRALTYSNVHLTILALPTLDYFGARGLNGMLSVMDEEDWANTSKALKNLTALKLYVRSALYEDDKSLEWKPRVHRLLAYAPNLRSLDIRIVVDEESETVVLCDIYWPVMEHMALRALRISSQGLAEILKPYKLSLKSLVLEDIHLYGGTWEEVLSTLQGGSLQSIKCSRLYLGDNPYIYGPLHANSAINDFVVGNGPWPLELNNRSVAPRESRVSLRKYPCVEQVHILPFDEYREPILGTKDRSMGANASHDQ